MNRRGRQGEEGENRKEERSLALFPPLFSTSPCPHFPSPLFIDQELDLEQAHGSQNSKSEGDGGKAPRKDFRYHALHTFLLGRRDKLCPRKLMCPPVQ